jgi:hypothetical protein
VRPGTALTRGPGRLLKLNLPKRSHMSGIIVIGLFVYAFVSYNRGQYGRTFLSLTAASALFAVTFVLPLAAHALAVAAVR